MSGVSPRWTISTVAPPFFGDIVHSTLVPVHSVVSESQGKWQPVTCHTKRLGGTASDTSKSTTVLRERTVNLSPSCLESPVTSPNHHSETLAILANASSTLTGASIVHR